MIANLQTIRTIAESFLPEVTSDTKGILQYRTVRLIEYGVHLSPPGCQPFNQVMIPTPISTTPTIDT